MCPGCSAVRRSCRGSFSTNTQSERGLGGGIQAIVSFPCRFCRRPPPSPNSSFRRRRNPALLMKQPCVYILASKRNGTLYLGVTSNLMQRVWQHKSGTSYTALYRPQFHERKPSRSGSVPGRLSRLRKPIRNGRISLKACIDQTWLRSGNSVSANEDWIPAFAGMTKLAISDET